MKKIIISLVAMLVTVTASAQQFEAPAKTKSHVVFTDTTTTYTYKTTDNKVYKVFHSKSGAYYIWKVSKKTNKPYKMYLPKEIQIKMGRTYNK